MKYVITLNGRTYEVEAETAEPLCDLSIVF